MNSNHVCFGLKRSSKTDASTCNAVLDCIVQSCPSSEEMGRGLGIDDSQGVLGQREREPVNEGGRESM